LGDSREKPGLESLEALAGMVSGTSHVIEMNAGKCQIGFSSLRIISEPIVIKLPERLSFDGICPAHAFTTVEKEKR
jgi:hypothetical protein